MRNLHVFAFRRASAYRPSHIHSQFGSNDHFPPLFIRRNLDFGGRPQRAPSWYRRGKTILVRRWTFYGLASALEAAFEMGGVHLVAVPVDYSENKRVLVDELRQRCRQTRLPTEASTHMLRSTRDPQMKRRVPQLS